MVRRAVRLGLWAGLAGAVGVGLLRAARWFRDVGAPPLTASWPPIPSGDGPAVAPAAEVEADPEPDPEAGLPAERPGTGGAAEPVDGACPASHPVKGKASSGLYHLPGMVAYERTNADTCFVDADAAEAAGFTRAKR
ncbi:MAG: hypothetical protein AB7H43_06105 [Acidimicrobiia bacterium]